MTSVSIASLLERYALTVMRLFFAIEILERIVKDLEDVGKVEQEPRAEGRTLQMLVVPKK